MSSSAQVRDENAHLVVVDPTLRAPVGVISSLDVARAIAWVRRKSILDTLTC
jgi:hypothetical protein